MAVTNLVRCPRCGKCQLPAIRVQTICAGDESAEAPQDSRQPLRVLAILLLALSIFGLPIALWLCKRFEKEHPARAAAILKYSYACSLCGHAWSWQTNEPPPQIQLRNSTPREDENKTFATTPQTPVQDSSFLHQLVNWWFRV